MSGALIMVIESFRIAMKVHSYFRTVLISVDISEKPFTLEGYCEQTPNLVQDPRILKLSKKLKYYLYFLIAPTLIYRDRYPRKKNINYGLVLIHLMNFFLSVFFAYILAKVFIYKNFENGIPEGWNFALMCINFGLPATFFFLIGTFGLSHSW